MSTQSEHAAPTVVLGDTVELTYREAVCAALEDEMLSDPRVLLLGEDVANDGGVFKTNVGLPEKFPGRVTNTPICENTFIGAAIGMAVTGLRPVVEIMFSDFLPTAGDALVEELPKFRFMSGGQCSVPVTIRSIGGGTGRFGTQHSATGESWFIGLPGLKVAAGGTPAAAYGLLRAAIRDPNPVLLFEHKGLYGRKGSVVRGQDGIAVLGQASVDRAGTDLTIVSTLLMTDRSLQASEQLAQAGIDAEVIDLRFLRPLDHATIEASVSKTGRLLVVEEQVHAGGWGATVISRLAMASTQLHTAPRTVSLPDDLLISYSPPLEDEIIPSVEAIAAAAEALMS
jgi:acetoin:2,6-dichlorophenolindophenol oxidoreductase subunit beta